MCVLIFFNYTIIAKYNLLIYSYKRGQVDLKDYEKDKTHSIVVQLEDGAGSISILVTITGIYSECDSNDITNINNDRYYIDNMVDKYVI